MEIALRWAAMFAVALLPGLGISAGLRRHTELSLVERLLIGTTLSPLVVIVVFFAGRFAGLSVPAVSYVSLGVALAAGAYFVVDARGSGERLSLPSLSSLFAALPGLGLFVWIYGPPHVRSNQGHVWMHADPTYAILQGSLHPEETIFAGIDIGYPFLPYAYQAVLSLVRDQSPVFSFVWPQLFFYVIAIGLGDAILRRLGAGARARAFGVLFLSFGLNPVGYTLRHALPEPVAALNIWGELRYSPWMQKYLQASHMPYAQNAFMGVVLLALSPLKNLDRRGTQALLLLLVLMVGLTYPVMYLQVVILVAALGVAIALHRLPEGYGKALRTPMVLAIAGVIMSVGLLAYLGLLSADKGEQAMVLRSKKWQLLRKTAELPFVLSLMLPGLWTLKRGPRLNRIQYITLLSTAAASVVLYMVLHMPSLRNEYKFVYALGIVLFPFTPLLLDRWFTSLSPGRWAGFLALAAGLLLAPVIHYNIIYSDFANDHVPHLETEGVWPRLTADTPRGGTSKALFEAIRAKTPEDAVLVLGFIDVHVPTIALRPVFVMPRKQSYVFGFNYPWLPTMTTRGYDLKRFDRRVDTVMDFYESSPSLEKLRFMAQGERPLAVVVEPDRHPVAARFMREQNLGELVFEDTRYSMWVVRPNAAPNP